MPFIQQPYVYQSDPLPETPKNKRWLLIGVGVGAGLLVLVTLILIFLHYRGLANARLAKEEAERAVEVQSASEECARQKDPAKCLSLLQKQLAQEQGDEAYCQGLEAEAYDGCVTLAALTANDGDVCRLVVDDAKQSACNDAVLAQVPAEDRTYALCDQISDQTFKERCQSAWILQQMKTGNCVEPYITDELCATGAVITTAEQQKNPDLCQQIADQSWQDACVQMVGPADRDGDGLSENQELKLGTSDTNRDSDGDGLTDDEETRLGKTDPAAFDTDGDGYGDGQEVNSGYNPLGNE